MNMNSYIHIPYKDPKVWSKVYLLDNGALRISNLRPVPESCGVGWEKVFICIRARTRNCNLKMNLHVKAVTQSRISWFDFPHSWRFGK